MRTLHFVVAISVAIRVATSGALAQTCGRPELPPGGFSTTVVLAVPVTYSDGYQSVASLIHPSGPPPSCGWPLVVFVHPLGQSRGFDLPLQFEIARQGYAVWSYDVRAQGEAAALNATHPNRSTTLWGPIERQDLAEQIQFVAGHAAYAGIIDATRVAVTGNSQGGAHAWAAAAWSGEVLPALPGRTAMTFPAIACAIANEVVPSATADWLRGGHLFSSWFLEAIRGSVPGLDIEPALVQLARAAFLAQDTSLLAPRLAADERDLVTRLTASTVPVLYAHAYFDQVCPPLAGLGALEARTAPSRALIGTLGHGSAENLAERRLRGVLTLRWLHRFLWGIQNGVELERPVLLAELPLAAAERNDPASLWSHTHSASTAPPPTAQRLFLHDDHTLREQAPVPPQSDAVVQQVIDPLATTFTPLDYLDQPAVSDLANVLAVCPLQQQAYTLTTTAPALLARSAALHLRVVPGHPAWTLVAQLSVEPPDVGAIETVIASGAVASRVSTVGVAETHQLRLPPVAVRMPAGSIVRLRLRNLWLREPPMSPGLEAAPMFTDFQVAIVHDAVAGSWLDLPLEPVAPRLVADRQTIDLASPQPIAATLRSRPGLPFFAAVGISGHQPGIPYLNDVVPVAADWLVQASAGSSEPPFFNGFLGWLDAAGEAQFTLDLSSAGPLPQFLSGWQLTFAAFVWDGPSANTGAATNPLDVMLR